MDPLWVTVGVTVVLVCITGYYAYETRRIRHETLRPRLSLHTGIYTDDGGVHALKLRNTGPVARNLNLEIVIEWNKGTHDKEKTDLFVPSLNTGEEIYLPPKLDRVKAGKGSMTVSLTYKDASNKEINETLPPIEFEKESEISQVENPMLDTIDSIKRDIGRSLNDISRRIDKR